MCSLGDSEIDGVNGDGATIMEKSNQRELTDSDLCRKCKTSKADFILRGKDFYCKECFTTYFVHKFRSTIGKSKEIKHDDQILVAYSGGPNSTVLLHLIQQGLREDISKKIRFHPHVLFIDESTIRSSSPSIENVYEEISKLNFPFSFSNFEEVLKEASAELLITTIKEYEEKCNIDELVIKNTELSNELLDFVEQRLKSRTTQEDFLRQLKIEVISRCAKQLGFKKVFLADNATELSVQILSNVALGRGSQLADNVQFKSKHFEVEFFRPLREIFNDEINIYIKSEKIFVLDSDSKSVNSRTSVLSCTRKFIYDLQKEFFSTVPTVFRTGGKLISGNRYNSNSEVVSDNEGKLDLCLSCGLKNDISNSIESSAYNSINLAKKLTSQQPPNNDINIGEKPLKDERNLDLEDENLKNFCYGCSTLMREMGTLDFYPKRIRQGLEEKERLDQAKAVIQDYLIED